MENAIPFLIRAFCALIALTQPFISSFVGILMISFPS